MTYVFVFNPLLFIVLFKVMGYVDGWMDGERMMLNHILL